MVDFRKSDEMIKISGKVDKLNTDNGFNNISFFIWNDSDKILFPIKNKILLNPLSVFSLSTFLLIFIIYIYIYIYTHTHTYTNIYIYRERDLYVCIYNPNVCINIRTYIQVH